MKKKFLKKKTGSNSLGQWTKLVGSGIVHHLIWDGSEGQARQWGGFLWLIDAVKCGAFGINGSRAVPCQWVRWAVGRAGQPLRENSHNRFLQHPPPNVAKILWRFGQVRHGNLQGNTARALQVSNSTLSQSVAKKIGYPPNHPGNRGQKKNLCRKWHFHLFMQLAYKFQKVVNSAKIKRNLTGFCIGFQAFPAVNKVFPPPLWHPSDGFP